MHQGSTSWLDVLGSCSESSLAMMPDSRDRNNARLPTSLCEEPWLCPASMASANEAAGQTGTAAKKEAMLVGAHVGQYRVLLEWTQIRMSQFWGPAVVMTLRHDTSSVIQAHLLHMVVGCTHGWPRAHVMHMPVHGSRAVTTA